MQFREQIEDAERLIRKAGLTKAAFFRKAGVNQTTWHRWKTGATEPQMAVWRRVTKALEKLGAAAA